jgi:acetyl esterase
MRARLDKRYPLLKPRGYDGESKSDDRRPGGKTPMPELNPQMAEILALVAEGMKDRPERTTLSAVEARAQTNATFEAFWNADRPTLWAVYNHEIPGPRGPLRVRLYDPGVARPAPCLGYVHGGGWVICSLDTHDGLCRRLAQAGGFLVASVDYRLAPEHKFPAGLDDCVAAVRWLAQNGGQWGVDPARLAVGGDSAGANLALATLLSLRAAGEDPLGAGLLIYGAYAAEIDGASQAAFSDGSYILSSADMAWFWDHYLRDDADRRNPLAAPLLADLQGLPPLLVTAAEFDPLLDDSTRLVARLEAAAVPHRYVLWPGVTHACLHMTRMLDVAQDHIEDMAAWVRAQLK